MLEKGINPNTKLPVTPTIPVLTKLASGMNMTLHQLFSAADDMPVDILSPELYADNIIPLPQTKKIPLLGSIACGEPILAEENIEDFVKLDKDIPADFALRCKGDSMITARIFDGDIVYIRQQPDVENGEIAAVLIDNEATLKKVYKFPNKIVLSPCNPVYDDLIYMEEQCNNIRILGKAVAFTSIIK
ncbi:MAG: repressor LexA [Clostridia bacterium]|nr:repressor LexA [Clostridia bacterium]